MSLVVMKFGGSSVADRERIFNVAGIIEQSRKEGNDIVVVVSAQGDTTDELIEKAKEITAKPPAREMDMLLATGEQISASLLAMALDSMGIPAVSLTRYQAGFFTSSKHMTARIKDINTERVENELLSKKVVVITGFQGINKKDDITTLGRGGSDTSAVAIAIAIHADVCKIYTDVDGVYTADPRKVESAVKLSEIGFDEMLEFSSLGAKVLQNRAVELAQKYNLTLEVLSSLTGNPGTIIKEAATVEGMVIKGVTRDTNYVSVSVIGVEDKPGVAFKLFAMLGKKEINVDSIIQSVSRDDRRDIVFTVHSDQEEATVEAVQEMQSLFGYQELIVDPNIVKVSTVGTGMLSHSGIASRMFGALYDAGINIQMIMTSEIKLSVIIDSREADRAVAAIHDEFFRNTNEK